MEQVPSKKCHLCNNTRGLYFCYECKHVLCQECRLKHDRIPATKNHTIISADRVDLLAYTSKSECTTHDQECSLFCSTCKTLTCNQCVTFTHKHHSFVDISAVSSEARKLTQDYLLQIKRKISSLSNMIKRIEYGDMMALDEDSKNELFEIQCLTEKLWDIIVSQIEIKQKDVEEQMDIEKNDMMVHLNGLKQMYDAHNRMHTKLENLLSEKHDKSFFLCFQTLVKDFENVEEKPTEMRFSHLQKFNETEFVNSVTAMIVNKFSLRDYGRTNGLKDIITTQEFEIFEIQKRKPNEYGSINQELKKEIPNIKNMSETWEKENIILKKKCEMFEIRHKIMEEGINNLMQKCEEFEIRHKILEAKKTSLQEKFVQSEKRQRTVTKSNTQLKNDEKLIPFSLSALLVYRCCECSEDKETATAVSTISDRSKGIGLSSCTSQSSSSQQPYARRIQRYCEKCRKTTEHVSKTNPLLRNPIGSCVIA